MSTPTVIRHAVCGDQAAMVITVFDRREQQFLAYFQTYLVNGEVGRTGLNHSEVWTTEQKAIEWFENWLHEEARDDS
jgi:flavodoxin